MRSLCDACHRVTLSFSILLLHVAHFCDDRREKILAERSLEERSGSGDSKEIKKKEYAAYPGLPISSSGKEVRKYPYI